MPLTARSVSASVSVSRRRTASSLPSPSTSSTTVFQRTSIFGFANTRSCMIFDARSSLRRWMSVTFVAKRVRKLASSSAESPPPTTAIGRSRKKKPSHVAHGRHAVAEQALLGFEAEHPRGRAGGDDHASGRGTRRRRRRCETADSRQVDAVDVGGDELGAEARGLLPEQHHELGPEDAVGEAGEVLDVGRQHELAAGADSFDDDRVEIGPGGVDRGGEAGRSGSDDDDISNRLSLLSLIRCSSGFASPRRRARRPGRFPRAPTRPPRPRPGRSAHHRGRRPRGP